LVAIQAQIQVLITGEVIVGGEDVAEGFNTEVAKLLVF